MIQYFIIKLLNVRSASASEMGYLSTVGAVNIIVNLLELGVFLGAVIFTACHEVKPGLSIAIRHWLVSTLPSIFEGAIKFWPCVKWKFICLN